MKISVLIAAVLSLVFTACEKSPAPLPLSSVVLLANAAPQCETEARTPHHARGAGDPSGYVDLLTWLAVPEGQTAPPELCADWVVMPYVFDVDGQLQPQEGVAPFSFRATQCEEQIFGCDSSLPLGNVGGSQANIVYVASASNFDDCSGNPIAVTLLASVTSAAIACTAGTDVAAELTLPISLQGQ